MRFLTFFSELDTDHGLVEKLNVGNNFFMGRRRLESLQLNWREYRFRWYTVRHDKVLSDFDYANSVVIQLWAHSADFFLCMN